MGEIMKNVKAEFGKKAGKALGNALFGVYGEDKRVGVRFADGSRGKKKTSGRASRKEVEAAPPAPAPMVSKPDNTADRLREAESRKLEKRIDEITNIEFNPNDPAQIIRQLNKIASIAELALKNDDDKDDGVGKAAMSMFSNGLAMLKAVRPDNALIPHFEKQLRGWKIHSVWKAVEVPVFLVVWFGAIILFCFWMSNR